jgi:hypothetical protein
MFLPLVAALVHAKVNSLLLCTTEQLFANMQCISLHSELLPGSSGSAPSSSGCAHMHSTSSLL